MNDSEAITKTRKQRGCFFWGAIISASLIIVISLTAFITWRAVQSNIDAKPFEQTKLSQKETKKLNQNIERLEEKKGKKNITFTEKQLNYLLSQYTGLGKWMQLQILNNEISGKVNLPLENDFPLFGGRNIRAKGSFSLSLNPQRPELLLNELTFFGISLPNAWVGNMKGTNLAEEFIRYFPGIKKFLEGIESFDLKNGSLSIQLAD